MILQLAVVALCLILIIYIVSLIVRGKLLLKYSLLWLALALIVSLCALFPEPLYQFAGFLGFENPSNFIFLVGIFLLIVISLSLTSIVSKQTQRIKGLIQQQALLEKRLTDITKQTDTIKETEEN